MIKLTKYIAVLLLLLVVNSLTARPDYSAYSSVKIIPGAREASLGGCGVVSAIGPQAIYYNPALSSAISSYAINFNYTKWFLDMYEQSIFLVRSLPYFNFGFGIVNFNAGKLEYRPDYPTDEPIGEFNPSDFNFYLNLSRAVKNDNFTTRVGISGRYYYQSITDYSANTFGADLGLAFIVSPDFKVGLSLVNFATSMKFIRERFSIPTKLLSGIDYVIPISKNHQTPKLKLSTDLGYIFYNKKLTLASGLELSLKDKYFIRSGYKFNNDNNNQYSTGFGTIVKNFRIEYAYNPYNIDLGSSHHFSFSLGY